jgi:acyl-CoA thioester hydrolase
MSDDQQPFRFRHPVAVRFKDVDVGGHAHHSHALVYFEEARWAYWRDVVGRRADVEALDYVLAEATLKWHQRVLWPAVVDVGVRVALVGRKHFVMDYVISSAEGEKLVSGSTTQVMYDYAVRASVRLPEEVRERLEAFDGPFGRGGRWERPGR